MSRELGNANGNCRHGAPILFGAGARDSIKTKANYMAEARQLTTTRASDGWVSFSVAGNV